MIVFNGSKYVETLVNKGQTESVEADVAIIVASWETRSLHAIRRLDLKVKRAVLLSFENDELPASTLKAHRDLLSKKCQNLIELRVPEASDRRLWGAALQRALEEISANNDTQSIVIDYTCLPKAIAQTLFRAMIRKGMFAKMTWLYSLGIYSKEDGNLNFTQGVRSFFPIRHTPGDGGLSSSRSAIIGLGSDESLVIEFLEQYNFNRVFALAASSDTSPELKERSNALLARLVREDRVNPDDILECGASSVVECIEIMYKTIADLPQEMSFDIFCSGPKAHAIAACVVAEKFEKTVRLMGREVKSYARHEVVPEGTISIVRVTDYKNPAVRLSLF